MTRKIEIQRGSLLLLGVFILLSLTRVLNLESRQLRDREAVLALTAASGIPGGSPFWDQEDDAGSTSPLYHSATRLLFQTFGVGDAMARAVPAMGGLLLLLAVLIGWQGGKPVSKLIWLTLLGVSPVILTTGRIAGGDILTAAAILALFIAQLSPERIRTASNAIIIAIITALAITSGPAIYQALSGVAIAGLIAWFASRRQAERVAFLPSIKGSGPYSWLIPVVAVLILSGFGSSLDGLRGFVRGLEEWLRGWMVASGHSIAETLVLLLISEPVIVVFGILGIFEARKAGSAVARLAAIWSAGAAIAILIYPGRTPVNLIWVLLPLSFLAMQALEGLMTSIASQKSKPELIGLLALLFTFVASGVLSVIAFGSGNVLTINPENPNLVFLLFIALAVMGVSVLVFFGVGWSWKIVSQSLGLLMILVGFFQNLSMIWRQNFTREHRIAADLWWIDEPAAGLPILIESLEHTALSFSGSSETLPIVVQAELPPSVAWAMRKFEPSSASMGFGTEAAPVILAPEGNADTSLPADYIGQSLAVRSSRAWETPLPPDLLSWWIAQDVPVYTDQWVLWVRVDIASFGDIVIEG